MAHAHTVLTFSTRGKGLVEITAEVGAWVRDQDIRFGLLNVFIAHTSASLMIQENADPDVLRDIETFFARLVPETDAGYRHTMEGPDDMSAHVKSVLTQSGISMPVGGGRCLLGTWQGLFLWEHRASGHRRRLTVTVLGD